MRRCEYNKLHQNTTRRAALRGREHFDVRREVLLWGFVESWNTHILLKVNGKY